MRARLFFLWVFLGLSLPLSGCVTRGVPPPPTNPGGIPSPPFPPPSLVKKTPVAPEHPVSPTPPAPAPILSACGTITRSSSGQWLDFLMAGRGILPKGASDRAVMARAEKNAVDRLDRCSGTARGLSAFYEGDSVSSPRDRRDILGKIRKILRLLPRFHVVRESCRDAGQSRSCDVAIEGRVKRFHSPDPGFLLSTSGVGHSGLLRSGEPVTLRIFSTRPARVYLVDVDDRGRGVLLDPEPLPEGVAVPPGIWVAYPPDGQKSLSLEAALPPTVPKAAGHLWVVACEDPSPLPAKAQPEGAEGILPVFKDFFGEFLFPVVHLKAGWTFRVIPYEIVGGSPPSSGTSVPPIRPILGENRGRVPE